MIMVDSRDQYGYLTGRALQLRQELSSEPLVVILGASSIQHAIPTEDVIADMLHEKTGYRVDVVDLTAGGTTIWEELATIDFLNVERRVIYVVGTSMFHLSQPRSRLEELADHPRLGFTSQAFDEELHAAGLEVPRRTGVYSIDHVGFFLARVTALRNLISGPVTVARHNVHRKPLPEAKWSNYIAEWLRYRSQYAQFKEPNYGTMQRLVERARSRGANVVLLNGVTNPRAAELLPEAIRMEYDTDIRNFAVQHNVEYLNIGETASLTRDEFDDAVHVNSPDARRRFANVLTDHLAAVLLETDNESR